MAQKQSDNKYDAIVVGGGFFGCAIAEFLSQRGWQVALVERHDQLMQRASYVNQARLHNGYHYPRSFRTALRSRINLPVFCKAYPSSVFSDYTALYAIARQGSKVSAAHFERFCKTVGMPLRPAAKSDQDLFDQRLVEAVFEVVEPTFDTAALRRHVEGQLRSGAASLLLGKTVTGLEPCGNDGLIALVDDGVRLEAPWVFNCTYADLNHVSVSADDGAKDRFGLVHQIAELAIIKPPEAFAGRGVTVMDGPFFSTIPFPARQAYSLTHVHYTHHMRWRENAQHENTFYDGVPTQVLERYLDARGGKKSASNFPWMLREAQRFVPALQNAEYVDTLFDVKTLADGTQTDDARPVLFHRNEKYPGLISVLGGKIDNIFDILSFLSDLLDGPLDMDRETGT